jgi:hypothetical protein
VPPSRRGGSKLKVGYLLPVFLLVDSTFWDPLPIFIFCLWFSGPRIALANSTTQAQAVQTAYNSSQ